MCGCFVELCKQEQIVPVLALGEGREREGDYFLFFFWTLSGKGVITGGLRGVQPDCFSSMLLAFVTI